MINPRKNIIEDKLNSMTIPSDNMRVVSPYRIKARTESRPDITRVNREEQVRRINEAGKKQKAEFDRLERIKAEKEWQESEKKARAEAEAKVELERRNRIRALEDANRKKLAEQQRQYEEQKRQNEQQAAENKAKSNALYEKNYKAWSEDVEKNPSKYSLSTRSAVIAAKQSPAFDAMARALFGIKNYFGNLAINSIDTNGSRITGEIDLMQHKLDALPFHQKAIELDQSIADLEEERAQILAGRENGAFIDNGRLNEINSAINNLLAQRSDPELKKFDEDYKQLYTIDKEGVWDTVKRAYKTAISGMTYDPYKEYVAQRDRLRDVEGYYNSLIDDDYDKKLSDYKNKHKQYDLRLDTRSDYLKVFDRSKPSRPNRRDLYSYTPRELLNLSISILKLKKFKF